MLRSWDFQKIYEWRSNGSRKRVRILRVAPGHTDQENMTGKHIECIFEVEVLNAANAIIQTNALAKSTDLYRLDE